MSEYSPEGQSLPEKKTSRSIRPIEGGKNTFPFTCTASPPEWHSSVPRRAPLSPRLPPGVGKVGALGVSVQLPTPPGRCPKGHFLLASPGIARVSAQAAVSEEAGSRQARGGLRATRAWTSTRGAGAYRAYRPMHGLLQEAGEQADRSFRVNLHFTPAWVRHRVEATLGRGWTLGKAAPFLSS